MVLYSYLFTGMFPMRGTSQSALEYSLSLKNPKKTGLIIAFRIALTLDVKFLWFGRQVAVCVQKRHRNAIFGCSWFQKFNFDSLLHKLLICSPKTENIFKFVYPLRTQSTLMISGTQIYFTLFLASSYKS